MSKMYSVQKTRRIRRLSEVARFEYVFSRCKPSRWQWLIAADSKLKHNDGLASLCALMTCSEWLASLTLRSMIAIVEDATHRAGLTARVSARMLSKLGLLIISKFCTPMAKARSHALAACNRSWQPGTALCVMLNSFMMK